MYCRKCGYPNQPININCGYCGQILQSPDEALQQQEIQNDLPPDLKVKFEQQYQINQARFHRIIKYLRKTRLFHIILGAVLLSGIGIWAATFWVMDLVCGAFAGWFINRYQGGMLNGLFIMLGAYCVSFMTRLSLSGWGIPFLGFGGMIGSTSSCAIGFLFGLYVEQDLEWHIQ